ncbi:MAG: hypothetical protein JNM69_32025 [Archangium sp.]|nr:hypothetical protein [Archangium sp.]
MRLLLGLLVCSVACGTATRPCSTSTCTGCCDATGQCQPGTSVSACGARAGVCQVCGGASATCVAGSCSAIGPSGGGASGTGGGTGSAGGSGGGSAGGATAGGAALSPGDIILFWTFAGQGCGSVPQLATMRVTIPGQTLANGGRYPCMSAGTAGVRLLNFAGGSYAVTVEALDSTDVVLRSKTTQVRVDGDVTATLDLQ